MNILQKTKFMKRTIIKLTILILFSCFVSINSYSQVNMERFIEIRCDKGAKFTVSLAADSLNTKVILQNGYFNKPMTIHLDIGFTPSYTSVALDTVLRIYGNVTIIDFRGDGYSSYRFNTDSNTYITQMWLDVLGLKMIDLHKLHNLEFLHLSACQLDSIDVSNLNNLVYLDVSYNENLKKLDLRGVTKLSLLAFQGSGVSDVRIDGLEELHAIYCYDAKLSRMGFDSLFCALPKYSDDEFGYIVVIYDSIRSDYQTYMASNSENAIFKRWFPLNRSFQDLPPTNGTFDCSSIGMDDIELDFVEAKVYPNPAIDYLSIETKEMVQMLEVYDALGRKAISKAPNQNNFSLDISNLEKGIYIIKLLTKEGIGSYKIVKN